MRKIYMKPIMVSEEFMANDYFALCWTFDCRAELITIYDPSLKVKCGYHEFEQSNTAPTNNPISSGLTHYYNGKITGGLLKDDTHKGEWQRNTGAYS